MKLPRLNLRIARLLPVCIAALASVQVGAEVAYSPEQHFHMALEEQSHRDYRAMLEHLRTAAGMGFVEAQETLGMVLMAGPTLYGSKVRADRCEAFRWFLAAAKNGSELGVQHVHFMNRARSAPAGLAKCKDY